MNKIKNKTKSFWAGKILAVYTAVLIFAAPTHAAILFQNDDFAEVLSSGLTINSDNQASGDIILQFGQSLGEYLKWNTSLSSFQFSDDLDISNNELTTARIENVSSMPGGISGLGSSEKGRIVQLTSTDSTAPGCTGTACSPGTFTWDGSAWQALQGSTNGSSRIVTVGPSGRDFTALSSAATFCNTLSGCEMWIDPGTYSVTSSIDLENTKLIGADGNGITEISLSGSGKLQVKGTYFDKLKITVGAISASSGLDVKYSSSSSSSVVFTLVNFSTASGKYILGSTAATPPVTILNFVNCSEAASDPGSFINVKASSGLNTTSSIINVINQLSKDPLKISDWPVTIVGGSNVVTSGTITSVPDKTIYVSADMDINNAIQSLVAAGGSGVIKLLVGTHNITSPILLNSSNMELVGEGPGSIINAQSSGWTGGTGATVAAIQVGAAAGTSPVNNVVVRNFTLKVEPDVHGIKVNGGSENKVTDMIVQSTGQKTTNTHTAIVFTNSTGPVAQGTRMVASRNIINRSDAISCALTGFCWVDGIHFDGDAGFGAQSFGYSGAGSGIADSIVTENIVNETKQTSYVLTGASAVSVYANRSRNIGITAGSLGFVVNNSSDVSVIGNSVEANNSLTTTGISLYNNVQTSSFIGNVVDNGGITAFTVGIDIRSGATASNDNIVNANQITGATTGVNIGATNLRNIVADNQFVSTTTRLTDSGTSSKLEVLHHEAIVAPGATDDITKGYSVGTVWVDTLTNAIYVCANSTASAAVWTTSATGHTQNTDTGTNQTTFTLNNGNTNTTTTLTFGGTSPQTFAYNPTSLRFDLSKDLNITGNLTASGKGLLGTTGTANTTLDVNGDVAMRSTNVALANGTNNNVAIGAYSNIRITGPTAAFTITGMTTGVNGKLVELLNPTSQQMTLANESASSTAANRIITGTGLDLIVESNNAVSLIYDSTQSRWVVTGFNSLVTLPRVSSDPATCTAGEQYYNTTTNTVRLCIGANTWTGNGPSGTQYFFAYDTTTQTVATAATFQDVTFNTNAQIDGWTHTASTATFTSSVDGTFMANITARIAKSGGANTTASLRLVKNGTEVAGSQAYGGVLGSTGDTISGNFIFVVAAGDVIKVQLTGGTNSVQILPGGHGTTQPSIQFNVWRMK